MFRSLGTVFEERQAFLHEYQRNIANGGLFVPTPERFELREVVDLELDLRFCNRSVTLSAEVVQSVPPGLEASGGEPGVAVQFLMPAGELRDLLGRIAGVPMPTPPPERWPGRPGRTQPAARSAARLTAQIEVGGATRAGYTRDLSRSGVLVTTAGEPIPVGSHVRVTLVHPRTGEKLAVAGTVVRHGLDHAGRVVGAGIRFDVDADDTRRLELLEDLSAAAHALERAAIRGPVGTLGLASLIQMFSSCTSGGTLTLTRGDAEGCVVFEGGRLLHASAGNATGAKALARLVAWEDGSFSFAPVVPPTGSADAAVPIYGALLEAVHQLDELRRLPLRALPPSARLVRTARGDAGEVGALEEVLLELARRGATVLGAVDALREPDAAVYRALLSLIERGRVRIEPAQPV